MNIDKCVVYVILNYKLINKEFQEEDKLDLQFKFNKSLYSKEALIKAAYNYIDDFYLHLDCDEEYFLVEMQPRRKEQLCPTEKEFQNEMLIQETRRIVNERTSKLREMMYARALASTVIEEPTEDNAAESDNAEQILVDWFEKNG